MTPAEFILGPQASANTYYDQTLLTQAKLHGEACPAEPPADASGLDSFILLQYYDLPLTLYTAYARTGDQHFLGLARKCADAWFKHPAWIGEGKIRLWPDNMAPPPRHAGVGGLLLRALDGRPEIFDWVNAYTDYAFYNYVGRRLTKQADGTWRTDPLYDLREGAFSFRYKVWLSQVLPDSFPNAAQLRARYLQEVELVAVEHYGKTQRSDGAWPWNDAWVESDGGTLQQVTQPFIAGLLLRSLCDAHQVVGPVAKASIEKQILNGCRQLHSGGPYIKDQVEQVSGKRVRGFHYYYHGGTSVNPTRYAKGNIPDPWIAEEAWYVAGARQGICPILGSFGYAYKISGDAYFKTAGDEMFDAAFGGSDGVRALIDASAKNLNQSVWGSSNYLAWVGGTVSVPTPQPLPEPEPTPTPSPTPTPTTPTSPVIITFPASNATLSGMVEVTASAGDGVESSYLIVDDIVHEADPTAPYTYKLDTTLLKDGVHSMYVRAWVAGKAVDSTRLSFTVKNAVVEPTPTPTPEPTPTPTPAPCTMTIAPVTLAPFSKGKLVVNLSGLTGPATVRASAVSGQVTVSPSSQPVKPEGTTAAIVEFQLQSKKTSGNVVVTGPCGSQTVVITVR